MNNIATTIPLVNLSIAFIPALVVVFVLFKWSLGASNAMYGLVRMLGQLLLVGYFLAYIFESDSAWIVLGILSVMVFASSWIALGTIKDKRLVLYKQTLVAITLGGGIIFIIITQGVLQIDKWYSPQYTIPLAGMIFANSMNCVSLAVERLAAEIDRGVVYIEARRIALQASLIPVTNSLFAVGLVALPGMMTGQILSGVSPLIASRYQIMVMCMIFAAAGISTVIFLVLARPVFDQKTQKI
ncbi:MAG TPA: ABC transporter permease [Piscirickettsiaceae bacterium]|jgi:putative ABC transport system permease protein|nr:ABC transporter permease [Piscirickettsiaceae bacterium]